VYSSHKRRDIFLSPVPPRAPLNRVSPFSHFLCFHQYNFLYPKSKLCYDRRSVGQSVLVSGTQNFITVRQLRVCWCGATSLTRGRVCSLQLLLCLASSFTLGSESRSTHDHILLSQIGTLPNLRARSLYLCRPRTGWPSYTRHGLCRKRLFHQCCVLPLQWKHAFLRNRYLEMAVI
jgi:hypothetical protein